MTNFLIIYYNTPSLTSALVMSINKFVKDAKIYIFDNSNSYKFENYFDNVTVFDNTNGQIINFDKELQKYPKRLNSLGRYSNFGSFKHCISVDKCFDLIGENFILLDSDVLLKKDPTELVDENVFWVGELVDWGWGIIGNKGDWPKTKRVRPFICFINVKKCLENGIRFFDEHHMAGLWNPDKMADSYDTGGYLWLMTKDGPYKEIKFEDYVVHYGGGSYLARGSYAKMSKKDFLDKYMHLYRDVVPDKTFKTTKRKTVARKKMCPKNITDEQCNHLWQAL